ncbi:MAG: hypothetical protein JW839_13865 [Candidatus Lokiarchaeota archaeon]|nr:hypothetical protein [Candidatus Lokiarchaeota archaeon]
MVETRHVKTITVLSLIIAIFGFFVMMLLLSGLVSSGGMLFLSPLGFFNAGLNMEITFLVFPALVMLLLGTKSIKVETSLGITRILSLLSFLMIVVYGIFVCIGTIVPELDPINHAVVDVFLLFIVFFAIEAALHLVVFWLASRSLPRT